MLKSIDISRNIYNIPFFARLIWQELFNIYRTRGGSLDDMDSMLIDLDIIRKLLEEEKDTFYWTNDYSVTHIHVVQQLPNSYRIHYSRKKITITLQDF